MDMAQSQKVHSRAGYLKHWFPGCRSEKSPKNQKISEIMEREELRKVRDKADYKLLTGEQQFI